MSDLRGYGKIMGFEKLPQVLDGHVIIEEKVDGSQFRWLITQDKEAKNHYIFGSKRVEYTEIRPPEKPFNTLVEQLKNMKILTNEPTIIYGEFLNKPKHNTLVYERVPKHNLVIFDVMINGKFLNYEDKKRFAELNDFEVVPLLWEGKGSNLTLNKLKELANTTQSFLGNTTVEGVVIKNYEKFHTEEYLLGTNLMAKYVRDEFRELNKEGHKRDFKKGFLNGLSEKYANERRLLKVIQHLRDEGKIKKDMSDLQYIIPEFLNDLESEEKDAIKEQLYNFFWKKELRKKIAKFIPQTYKDMLFKEVLK